MPDLTAPPTDDLEVEVLLMQALEELATAHPDDLPGDLAEHAEQLDGSSTVTFDAGGYLGSNKGLVLRLRNGAEFQISIVQSAQADCDNANYGAFCSAGVPCDCASR